ncbi:MAG: GspJ family type II secretion system protein [Candidatus Hydrogenedentes bacterium]|nr:GspJ family type II secretion system protein [Candidatus Hydrogenedentota bacterium]
MRKERGFTLVEILTVLAVLSVLSTIGVVMFGKIMDFRKKGDIIRNLNTRFLDIVVRMEEDFEQLASPSITGCKILGERHVESEKRYQAVPLDDDRLILPVLVTNSAGKVNLVRVKYYIDRMLGGAPKLVRMVGKVDSGNVDGAKEILISGVLAMRVVYYDGESWVDAWDRDYYPKGVKICLVLADEDRPWEQVVREKVFWIGNLI